MLSVILEVDQNWRCDAVRCVVQGIANGGEICGENVFHLGLFLEGDEEAKDRANSIGLDKQYERIVDGQRKVLEIEGSFFYPQLGLGSKAEQERIKVKSLQKDFAAELTALRRFTLK